MCTRACRLIVVAAGLLLATRIASADVGQNRSVPPDEERFVSALLPKIAITTSTGARTDLQSVANGRPLLLAFVFTRCTGVCSPFLMSWRAAEQQISRRERVSRLVLSFDPRDTRADMAEIARHLGAGGESAWTFGVAAPEDVRQLAETVGFWYDWDESRQQFDHPAMLAAVRNGRLVRLLIGGIVTSGRLDELIRDATGEFVPSYPLPGRTRFRCFQYDARSGRMTLDWGFGLLLVPVFTVSLATAILFTAGARVRRRGSVRLPPSPKASEDHRSLGGGG
jgi:cytochrome oxidase Cu insertion factor (SCO1/SenC/PrrC family)